MILLLSPLSTLAQELGTAEIEIVPPNPTSDDAVSVKLSGTWPNTCTPRDPGVSCSDQEISIDTSNPGQFCALILTSWALEVPVGRLPAGTYEVTARDFVPIGGPRVLGQAVFTVEAVGVGGVLTGLSPKRAAIAAGRAATAWSLDEDFARMARLGFIQLHGPS